jgi:hypothetical protein
MKATIEGDCDDDHDDDFQGNPSWCLGATTRHENEECGTSTCRMEFARRRANSSYSAFIRLFSEESVMAFKRRHEA